jgi:hypothetical protein
MATMSDVVTGARTVLRDFPQFFEIDLGPLNTLTIRLPHPLVSAQTISVYVSDITVDPIVTTRTTAWELDERNGLLKLTDETMLGKRVIVNGYHFTWFLDSDLMFHAKQVWGEMTFYRDLDLAGLGDAEMEVIDLGVVVRALWSLTIELALDIDVSTPEGMFIPARQRYTQVLQMLGTFEGEFTTKAGLMNMGLGALEQFRLRRVSLFTGRFVPVYVDREVDDWRWPKRLYPPIPEGGHADQSVDYISDALGVTVGQRSTADERYMGGSELGWRSIGTSGDG